MASAEGMDIDMDIGDREGGAEPPSIPGDWTACTADRSVATGRLEMTDELAVDLGGLGDSLSVCESQEAPCALTSSQAVIEFTVLQSSRVHKLPR